MTDAYSRAVQMQRMAADPKISVFVSANAGSGKTRVLVDRVSRILLGGTLPDKILCLTYTKAAAAEMQSRLFGDLGDWSIMDSQALTQSLNTLENVTRTRSPAELGRARALFARALETPGGLKVQTIHAFCQGILKRFPLEAGIAPGTEAIDEKEARDLQQQVWTDMETIAVQNPSSELAKSIALLAAHKSDQDMDALYVWMMGKAQTMEAWHESGGIDALAKKLGIPTDLTVHGAMEQAWEGAPKDAIKIASDGMLAGGVTDVKKAKCIIDALKAEASVDAYRHYTKVFFTQKNTPLAKVVGLKVGETATAIFGNGRTGYQGETLRMFAAHARVVSARVLELTRAVFIIADSATGRYKDLKKQRRVMDFDDQVYLARGLVMDGAASDWVRYKLDGGVDHILVDEAQDTSSVQWDIVDALSEPFFQPSPDSDPRKPRTLFAVGDEKQSIYGFQGAEPELFLEKIQNLITKQTNTPDVKMSMSFRSCAQILQLVDEVFYEQGGIQDMFDAETFPPASDVDGHSAHREDTGLVEFWPGAGAPSEADDETAWKPVPVDAPSAQSSREQLARQIAIQIKNWLQNDELIFDRKLKSARSMQASDIMILVTKRGDFFNGVIRNLKEQGVPVAGADRLKLADSIAVQDLLSLAKFTLLPSDDLSLAEVLKSPLFGWDDDRLFAVAHGRSGSLWKALPQGDDRESLNRIKSLARSLAPYEFFARTLAMVPSDDAPSLLQNIYNRLGLEAADALDVFLARALAHQRRGAPNLADFVAEIEDDNNTVKRELDSAQNEVRVMTVHGAKGLEAPVVILPDTTQLKKASSDAVYADGEGGFVFRISGDEPPEILAKLREQKNQSVARESMRLLYVALTRAESRLLVCGFESNNTIADGSWHDRIGKALGAMGCSAIETPFGEGLQFGQKPSGVQYNAAAHAVKTSEPLPSWARRIPAPAPLEPRRMSPSKLIGEGEGDVFEVPVRSPLHNTAVGTDRFARGNIIHKLLEILPEISHEVRRTQAQKYLKNQPMLGADSAKQIEDEVFAVLENPDFAPFFAKGSMAEVALAGRADGLPNNIVLNGQVDRLCVIGDEVWILDYKSNRPPPARHQDIALIYIRQMAAYRALARELYPNKTIHTALLWTDGPRLMLVPNDLLDDVDWGVALS